MKVSGYLIVGYDPNRRGKASLRITKTMPGLDWDEIAVKLNLELPDELFIKPHLQADITIPADSVSPPHIEAETINDIEEVVSRELGVKLDLSIIPTENK